MLGKLCEVFYDDARDVSASSPVSAINGNRPKSDFKPKTSNR